MTPFEVTPFEASAQELLLLSLFAIPAAALCYYRRNIWPATFAICWALASILTPADVPSTILLCLVLFACFFAGKAHGSQPLLRPR